MKLRNLALVFAIMIATPFVRSNDVQAGGDMSAGEPKGYTGAQPAPYPPEQYRPPYPRERYGSPYPRERYRPPYYGYGYGYDYGYGGRYAYENERTYVFGSYYRPYRKHYYSYSYPTPRPYRRDPLRSLQELILPLVLLGRL